MDEIFTFEVFAILLAAAPVLIMFFAAFVKFFGFIRNLFSSPKEYEALVLKKARGAEYYGNRGSKQVGYSFRVDVYFITFRTPKHKRIRLKVDGSVFRAAKEGDTGILTLQGKKFICFDKKAELSFYL